MLQSGRLIRRYLCNTSVGRLLQFMQIRLFVGQHITRNVFEKMEWRLNG